MQTAACRLGCLLASGACPLAPRGHRLADMPPPAGWLTGGSWFICFCRCLRYISCWSTVFRRM